MANIAVIQTAFPGDVILCTPVFQSLAEAGHAVTAVVRPQAEPLVRHNLYIDKLICYDKSKGLRSFINAVGELKKAECDAAIIVQRYLKSALLPLYAGIGKRIGFDIAEARFLYTTEIHYDKDSHEVERCLALCDGFSKTRGFAPRIFIDDETKAKSKEVLLSNKIDPANFIVIAPGSIWPTKRWTGFEQLITLIKAKLDCGIVMLGSADDYLLCEHLNRDKLAVNLAGKTDLLLSSAIIKMAKLAVANDSAPAHIAAAVSTPIVAIFGPTVPRFGFAPYSEKSIAKVSDFSLRSESDLLISENSIVVENKYLYCRPCNLHGSKKCPEKHFRCMKEITPEQVWKACQRLLEES
ncbi:MAG: glycosyltransferase family 9 protein [candidate division Zixibacteria bacterium]|nr:glycosyltransferase family 9 protein [candidate division Zixibacteria bacterium]